MRIFGLIMIIVMVFAGIASAQELWFYFDFESDEIDLDILAELLGYEDPGFNAELPDLAVVGVPEVVPGAVGNAWRFDGKTQINLNDFQVFERKFSKKTVMVWFNVDDTTSRTAGNVFMIYEEGGTTNGMCLLVGDDKLIACTRDNAVNVPENEKIVEAPFTDAGEWHHAAIVYNEGKLTLYLDGDEVGSLETGYDTDGSHPGCISSHTSNAAIGGAQGAPYLAIANSATFFAGMIDDFRVYKDYAFSASEIRSFLSLAVDYQSKVTRTWGAIKR